MQIHHYIVPRDFSPRCNLLNSCGHSLEKVGHPCFTRQTHADRGKQVF